MVSSRRMRSSRLPSPANATTADSEPSSVEARANSNSDDRVWQEPNLRPPAPSFEDYKGYERNSILKNMMPLGHFPSQKEKDKILKNDIPAVKKSIASKNGKNAPPKDDAETREATPVGNHVGSRESAPKVPVLNGKKGSMFCGFTAPSEPPPLSKATDQKVPDMSNNAHSGGRVRLESVVEAALRRATEQGNPYLGRAIERLWQDSIKEPRIADLMDAVLSQRPTAQQTKEFQERVRIAKKACKDADMSARHSSTGANSLSKSAIQSPSKSDRGSVARRLGTAEDSSDAPGSNTNRDLNPPSLKRHAKHMDANGTPSKPERPSKRSKRLKSFSSSTSSLSSISSTENETPSRNENDLSATAPPAETSPLDNHAIGPKLHSFPLNTRYRSTKRQLSNQDTQSTEDTADETDAKRRKLQKTHDVTISHSNIRHALSGTAQQPTTSERATPSITVRAAQSRLRSGGTTDELDGDSSLSPVNGELLAPPFPTDQMITRGATPNRLGRPPKNVRKGARVKMSVIRPVEVMPRARKRRAVAKKSVNSPQKAKGITAGRARPAGEVEIAAANSNDRDNDDYCAACGGTGQLLCCDNCVRSFHFTCLEPPLDEEHAPEGSWFCRVCRAEEQDKRAREDDTFSLDARSEDGLKAAGGVLGPLFLKLHGKIERSYALPKTVAEAFEGVKTGETGEYEEIPLPRSRTRSGDDALADIAKYKQKVNESVALCFKCGCSNNDLREGDPHNSAVPREMVSCDYCILSWHLDCLDPPLAINPKTPRSTLDGKKRGPRSKQTAHTWMCPNHAASDDPNFEFRQGVSRTMNGRIGKLRRPKHATIKDAGLSRGFHNNGLIEILNDPTEDEEEDDGGVIYRVSEGGIKLDFIDRVRQLRAASAKSLTSSDARKLHAASVRRERERAAAKADREELRRRSFAEQQVAMTLASLQSTSGSGSPINVGISAVDNLIGTLISEAPSAVQGMYRKEETLSETQKDILRKAKEEIERLLARS